MHGSDKGRGGGAPVGLTATKKEDHQTPSRAQRQKPRTVQEWGPDKAMRMGV
jgi:hypothetical protein